MGRWGRRWLSLPGEPRPGPAGSRRVGGRYLPSRDEYHECKGYLDRRSRVQLKRMRIDSPHVTVVVIDRRFFQPCEVQGVCRLIEGYACRHFPERLSTSPQTSSAIPFPQPTRQRCGELRRVATDASRHRTDLLRDVCQGGCGERTKLIGPVIL